MGISAGLCSDERAAHSASRTSRCAGCAAPVYCCNLVLEQSYLLSGWSTYHVGDGNWVRRTPVGTATATLRDTNTVRGKPVTAQPAVPALRPGLAASCGKHFARFGVFCLRRPPFFQL